MSVRDDIVAAARAEVGAGDIPKYWKSCGIVAPFPKYWCGGFALWAIHQAGVALDVKWKLALGFCEVQGLRRTKTPEPGDVAYTDAPWQHHAIVESFVDGMVSTIDGNQGPPQPVKRKAPRPVPPGMVFYSIDKFLKPGTVVAPSSPPASKPKPAATPLPVPAEERRGIDVSHHQHPSQINWTKLGETHDFVIVRATYGTKPDEYFAEHIQRALDVGLRVGAYHFFRPGQPGVDQVEAFGDVVGKAGMGPGWIAPALDVEQNQAYDGTVTRERYAPAEFIAREWLHTHGACLVYTNPSMWEQIGSPTWLDECSLWISHYGVTAPKTPHGLPWSIWQHGVAPLPGIFGAQIDQNVARSLPLIQSFEVAPLELGVDWDELRADRDAMIRDGDK